MVKGSLFLDVELSRVASAHLTAILWRDVVFTYLPFLERQQRTAWSQREQLASLADTLDYELEVLVGAAAWKATLKPGLIRHRAVIAGSWPLRVIMGAEVPADGTDIDILVPAPSDADEDWESPLAALFRTHAGGFRVHEAGGSEMTYGVFGIASVQVVMHTKPTLPESRRLPPFQLISVRQPPENPTACEGTTASPLVRWIEQRFDFDCCKTTYDPGDPAQPIHVSPSTTVDRLHRGEATFSFVHNPDVAWYRMLKYKRRGIVFDPIDPAALLAQIRAYVHGRTLEEKEKCWRAIALDVWACDEENTFCAFRPSHALDSTQFRRNVHMSAVKPPCTFVIDFHEPGFDCRCVNSPCMFEFCHGPHIHLPGSVTLLVHARETAVGSKRTHTGPPPADGAPSPTKRPRSSAPASASASASS